MDQETLITKIHNQLSRGSGEWLEGVGVEPTRDVYSPILDLKSRGITGTLTLPFMSNSLILMSYLTSPRGAVPGPKSGRPGRASVIFPPSMTSSPLTATYAKPWL